MSLGCHASPSVLEHSMLPSRLSRSSSLPLPLGIMRVVTSVEPLKKEISAGTHEYAPVRSQVTGTGTALIRQLEAENLTVRLELPGFLFVAI